MGVTKSLICNTQESFLHLSIIVIQTCVVLEGGREGGNFCVKSRFDLGVPPLMLPKVENSLYIYIYNIKNDFHSWLVVPKTHKDRPYTHEELMNELRLHNNS